MNQFPSREELRAMAAALPTRTLGAVVFPGFQLLDLWGPLEMFGNTRPAINALIVAETMEPVRSMQGPAAAPDTTLEDAPDIDMILISGGDGVEAQLETGVLADWILGREPRAEWILTVCTGAAILAQAGLLDGRNATTNKDSFRRIAAANPDVNWVEEARWVRDGKYVSSAGVSAGIDMALDVVGDMFGDLAADAAAVYTEYERHSDPGWDPFAAGARVSVRHRATSPAQIHSPAGRHGGSETTPIRHSSTRAGGAVLLGFRMCALSLGIC